MAARMRLGLAGAAGVPFAAMAAVGTVAAQFWYVAHRPLPSFLDLDPDGVFGPDSAPEVRLALLGDSTVTGPGLDSPEDLWSRQVVRRLAADLRIRLVSVAACSLRVGRGGKERRNGEGRADMKSTDEQTRLPVEPEVARPGPIWTPWSRRSARRERTSC